MKTMFEWPVRVYYEDTDAGGVVFYANYMKFIERGRTELLRSVGIDSLTMQRDFACLFVVKAVNVEYHASARMDELLTVRTSFKKIGRASLVFRQEVWRDAVLLTGADVVACCVDPLEWKATAIPKAVQALIRAEFEVPPSN